MPDSEDSVNLDEVSANLEKLIGLLEEIDLIQATASKQLEEADDLEEMDLIGATALNRLEDIRLQCQAAQRVGRGCRSPLMPRGGPDRYVARKVTAKDLWL